MSGAARELPGTSWRFIELYGAPVQASDRSTLKSPQLSFDANGRVFGTDGCNRLLGTYTIDVDRIIFNRMSGTQMACFGPQETAKRFRNVLNSKGYWQLDGGLLAFHSATGGELAILERLPHRTE